MKSANIMSHFDTYNLVIMTDNEITPMDLYNHFLHKNDVNSVSINYDKESTEEGLMFTAVKVVSDGGNYYEINSDKFFQLNAVHFLSIDW